MTHPLLIMGFGFLVRHFGLIQYLLLTMPPDYMRATMPLPPVTMELVVFAAFKQRLSPDFFEVEF